MYRQIVHFLQGQVLVRIECGCPERVLTSAAHGASPSGS